MERKEALKKRQGSEVALLDGGGGANKSKKKVFFAGGRSSTSSEEDKGRAHSSWRRKISGGCLCKLTALVYLVACVIVSAIYVAIYGQSQQYFASNEEIWVPGKPTHGHANKPVEAHVRPELPFYDLPYTEWISQRWTYSDQPFADWPSLPDFVDTIQQLMYGSVDGQAGVWLLTESQLLFAVNLCDGDAAEVQFLNISADLEIEIEENSRIAAYSASRVYVVTPVNVTLLDCSKQGGNNCTVLATNADPTDFIAVYSAVVSLSNGTLWIGCESGLFSATVDEEGDIVIQNSSKVIGAVQTLAWRDVVSDRRKRKHKKAFLFDPHVQNTYQNMARSSSSGAVFPKPQNQPKQAPIEFGLLVAGTLERLYFFDGAMWWFEWVSVWYNGLGGVVDGPPSGLTFTPYGDLFISNNVSLTRVNVNYTFDRIGPLEGLPYNEINAVYHSGYTVNYPQATKPRNRQKPHEIGGTLWIGTTKGYALLDVARSEFKGYFYGPRWHSGESILGFADSGNSVVLLTDRGITVVHAAQWTLRKKAEHYQAMLARHTRPPGLVADCPLVDFTPETCAPHTTDNDGLWTSWLVAAEAFRYQVTKDLSARANSWALFRGMQFLVNVTGVPGLMARSVVEENVSVSGDWYNSSDEPGWKWKGDTSSDEVVGHMFAYPIVYDLVASTPEEKNQVRELLDEVVGYIMNNSMYLIDVTNHSTRWGVWNPEQLNFNQSWADEHGLNALQALAFLLSAYRITGKAEYLTTWKELYMQDGVYEGDLSHYGLNMINQKITFPRDDNFSDDELAFLPYFLYFHTLKHLPERKPTEEVKWGMLHANLSLMRTWRAVGKEKSSAWTAIYAYAFGLSNDTQLIENLVWNLRTWPLELVEWPTTNSHRLDIRFNPEQDRDLHSCSQSVEVLPANERTQLRWNANPYQLDSPGSSSEMDPGAWLMPYWLARWIGML